MDNLDRFLRDIRILCTQYTDYEQFMEKGRNLATQYGIGDRSYKKVTAEEFHDYVTMLNNRLVYITDPREFPLMYFEIDTIDTLNTGIYYRYMKVYKTYSEHGIHYYSGTIRFEMDHSNPNKLKKDSSVAIIPIVGDTTSIGINDIINEKEMIDSFVDKNRTIGEAIQTVCEKFIQNHQ